ncbi:MAG: hypothetical protein ACI9BW_004306, partial [Gammaproteobacteria bacterium]
GLPPASAALPASKWIKRSILAYISSSQQGQLMELSTSFDVNQ